MKQTSINRRGTRLAWVAAIAGATLLVPSVALASNAGDPRDNGGASRHGGGDSSESVRSSIKNGHARNVILLIGDGMGDSEITVARNYQFGAAGRLPGIDVLPLTGSYTTYSIYRDGPTRGLPDYTPDSAATASAWSTGTKTYDGAISVDIDAAPQQTLIEIAKANGLKTGNVSTAEIQDATPAAQVAHVEARGCYGPDSTACGSDALEAGGRGSISEQLLGTRADVTLGGGSTSFTQTAKAGPWQGDTLFEQAEQRGYKVVGDAAELAAVTAATQAEPLLGVFTPGNFPTRYAPTVATVGGADQPPVTCQPNPDRLTTDLSLSALTNKAISLLQNRKGFFLQVEGASIDKRDHAADACGQIGETVDFDEAVQAALAFAEKDGNTLVIVTADHAHSSQIVDVAPATSLSTALTTVVDGTVLKISYGTAPAEGESQQHTGTQVRIAGYGPGAGNVVGLTDQTDTFFTIANALRLDRNTTPLSDRARITVERGSVRPGSTVTVSANRFGGDRQIGATLQPGGTTIGTADVIEGAAQLTFTAPSEPGEYIVVVAGAQTGKQVTARLLVRE